MVMSVPSFRRFWELLPLELFDYALIVGAVMVWMAVVRFAWRAHWFERFLHLDVLVDVTE
jgi:hypothetical protein